MQDASTYQIAPARSRKPASEGRFFFLLTLCIVVASWFLFFTHNRFSFKCHSDEISKIEQIQSGTRNYYHPLLMLNTAQAAFAFSGLPPEPQQIVWLGRMTVATFSTLMVLAFSCAAFVAAGRVASILCAVFLLGSPLLMEVSHYFKEDPSMVMGFGIAFFAIALYQRKPGYGNLLLLAAGAALSCSGKYLGVVILPFCIYTIFKEGGDLAKRHLLVFVAAVLGLYGLLNYQVILNFPGFLAGFDREVTLVGKGGRTVSVESTSLLTPVGKYVGIVRGNLPFPFFWFLGLGIYSLFKKNPTKTPLGQALVFAAVVLLLLMGTPKTAGRYALPVVCALSFAAALGAAWSFARPGWRWRIFGFALPVLVAVGIEIGRCHSTYSSFKHDSRMEMARWISLNLPKEALIGQEANGLLGSLSDNLSDSPYKVPQRIYEIAPEAECRSLDSLRSNGVQYVALVITERVVLGKPKTERRTPHEVYRAGEREGRCKKVWESIETGSRVINVRPDVAVYQLLGD